MVQAVDRVPAGGCRGAGSGGSAANLTALACAREATRGDAPGPRDLRQRSGSLLGRPRRPRPRLPARPASGAAERRTYRLRPDALRGAIAADREAGLAPFAACASAGSTNTGASIRCPIGRDRERERAWLHVDGAYGGFAALTERGAEALQGIERADSVTLDPHKWLYQPFECGCLLVREGPLLDAAFRISPHYLKDTEAAAGEVDFADRGLQLSRMARSLKVWMSVNAFGVDAFRAAIDRSLDLAALAQR